MKKTVRQRERSFTLAEMLVAVALSAAMYVMFTQVFLGAMKIINETNAYFNVYHQIAGAYTTMRENSEQHPIRWWDHNGIGVAPGWRKPPLKGEEFNEKGELIPFVNDRPNFLPYFVWTNKKKNPNTNVMEASADLMSVVDPNSIDLSPVMLLHGIVKNYRGPANYPAGNSNYLRLEEKSIVAPHDRLYDGPGYMPKRPAWSTVPIGGIDQCYQLQLYLIGEGKTPSKTTKAQWFIFRFWVF